MIQDPSAVGGRAPPSGDRSAFAEAMPAWEQRSRHEAAGLAEPVPFDRGLPHLVGHLRPFGLSEPAHAEAAARPCRYEPPVFVAPPWGGN
ncbi:hypothetical protein D3218_14995 [Aureimonas flava]|uniref:NadR/Ttd14 AAA domain-containing protein n=1 Tax=Aureimonas flava TaxID=2320271 RepID=A0A3A1WI40_9HYPH|nr:hypothetical protein [Aureimonas flava]RIX99083.1 hypothetical protein D3218_14995 [Aureimonas flava]